MSTRKKIISGFVAIFIIGVILGICGLIAANTLTSLSQEQYDLQTTSSGISTVLNSHYIWRQDITESVLTGSEFTGSLDSANCSLGKWRNSEEAKSITDPEVLALIKQIDEPHSYIHEQAKNVVAMIGAGDFEGAQTELVEHILPRTADVIAALTAMETRYTTLLEEKGAEILNMGNTITLLIIILLAIATAVCVLLAAKITSSIMNPVRQVAAAAKKISTGDLDVEVTYSVNDEIGQLAGAFQALLADTRKQVAAAERMANGDLTLTIEQRGEKDAMNRALKDMVDNLNDMFGEIRTASEQVSSGAGQVSQGAQSLASGSSQQAASIEELSASLFELQDKTEHNAEDSTKAQDANRKTAEKLEACIHSMGKMLDAMKAIDESSGSITKVIKVIDDIAFQTNILALNAAVEAARAGQHGKGFAVVADEVRNLAAKSAEAAKETSALIEGSTERVKEGNEIVEKTNADLEAAVENARESTRLIEQVAAASVEQARSIGGINQGMEQISTVVQANSATAEQSAAASQEMSAQAVVMNEIVEKFKLRQSGRKSSGASSQSYPAEHSEAATGFAMSGSKY